MLHQAKQTCFFFASTFYPLWNPLVGALGAPAPKTWKFPRRLALDFNFRAFKGLLQRLGTITEFRTITGRYYSHRSGASNEEEQEYAQSNWFFSQNEIY